MALAMVAAAGDMGGDAGPVAVWPAMSALQQERDAARYLARALWDFIEEGDFFEEVQCAEPGTPEWELWIKKWVIRHLVDDNPWVRNRLP